MEYLPVAVIVSLTVTVLAVRVVTTVRVDAGKVLTVPEMVTVLAGSV